MGRARRRVEQKREGWWRETPLWAWCVMVIGVVLIAVLVPVANGRGQVSPSQLERLNKQVPDAPAAPTSAAPATVEVPPARIVVIGDIDTGGSVEGGNDEAGWPALLEAQLPDATVEAVSAAGAGYIAVDPETGQTFSEVIDNAPVPGAAAVIVFGSRNDGPGMSEEVALSALNKIRLRAPAARLVVVGPLWPSSTAPAVVRGNRDAIEAAAEALGATFIDPIAAGWFVGQPGLIGGDGVNLTNAGHAHVAEKMETAVRAALSSDGVIAPGEMSGE